MLADKPLRLTGENLTFMAIHNCEMMVVSSTTMALPKYMNKIKHEAVINNNHRTFNNVQFKLPFSNKEKNGIKKQ